MSENCVYGYPCVEDPHNFTPDAECCSPAELDAHRLACAMYGKSDYRPNKGCYSEYDAAGGLVTHVARSSWGIGVNVVQVCDGCSEPCGSFVTCHDCQRDYCAERCWPEHDKQETCP